MERYPLVSPKNLPAYAAVMGTWLVTPLRSPPDCAG